jgi:hypothetical protein
MPLDAVGGIYHPGVFASAVAMLVNFAVEMPEVMFDDPNLWMFTIMNLCADICSEDPTESDFKVWSEFFRGIPAYLLELADSDEIMHYFLNLIQMILTENTGMAQSARMAKRRSEAKGLIKSERKKLLFPLDGRSCYVEN